VVNPIFFLFILLNAMTLQSQAALRCSSVFMEDGYELAQQWETALQRNRIQGGGLNLSSEFKASSSQLEVRFQNEKSAKEVFVFGRPYFYNGERVVDFGLTINQKVLSRISVSDLFAAALAKNLKAEIAVKHATVLLPSQEGRAKNNFQVFYFDQWRSFEGNQIEVRSIFGERRVVSLEDYFEGLLVTDQNMVKAAESFYEAGGRGSLFYTDAEVNPAYHGLSILIEKWPTQALAGKVFQDPQNGNLIQEILKSGTAVVYSLGSRIAYKAAAGEETQFAKFIKNRVDSNVAIGSILLLTEAARSDVIVHEKQHLDDYKASVKKNLVKQMESLRRKYESRISAQSRVKNYDLFFDKAVQVAMEQRAYAMQINYLQEQVNKGDIDKSDFKSLVEEQQYFFGGNYVTPFVKSFVEFKNSGADDIALQVQQLVRENFLPSVYFIL